MCYSISCQGIGRAVAVECCTSATGGVASLAAPPDGWQEIFDHAQRRCAQYRVPLTGLRVAVLDDLWTHRHTTVGIYEVAARLTRLSDKSIAPNSVHRAIKQLCSLGLASRIESRNAYLIVIPGASDRNIALLCTICRSAVHIESRALDELQLSARTAGFLPISSIVELKGRCAACQV